MMDTLFVVIEQILLYMPLVIGAYFSFILLDLPDLSIESAFVIGALSGLKGVVLFSGIPLLQLITALLLAALGGSIVGLVAGSLTYSLSLQHVLSSLITLGLFQGVSYWILGGAHQTLTHYTNPLMMLSFAKSPELGVLLILMSIFIIALTMLLKTQLGYCLAAYGLNAQFFSHYGISGRFVFLSGLMISNALAGISGYLLAQSNGYVDMSMGYGVPLLCLSMLILGSLFIRRTHLTNLIVPVLGVSSYMIVQQLLLKVGCTSLYFTSVQALIVLIGIMIRVRMTGLSLFGIKP